RRRRSRQSDGGVRAAADGRAEFSRRVPRRGRRRGGLPRAGAARAHARLDVPVATGGARAGRATGGIPPRRRRTARRSRRAGPGGAGCRWRLSPSRWSTSWNRRGTAAPASPSLTDVTTARPERDAAVVRTATTRLLPRVLADQAFSRAAGAPLVEGNAVRLL